MDRKVPCVLLEELTELDMCNTGGPSSYETGTSYEYDYEGLVTSSTEDFPAGMKIETAVNFDFVGRRNNVDTVLMKVSIISKQ